MVIFESLSGAEINVDTDNIDEAIFKLQTDKVITKVNNLQIQIRSKKAVMYTGDFHMADGSVKTMYATVKE